MSNVFKLNVYLATYFISGTGIFPSHFLTTYTDSVWSSARKIIERRLVKMLVITAGSEIQVIFEKESRKSCGEGKTEPASLLLTFSKWKVGGRGCFFPVFSSAKYQLRSEGESSSSVFTL